VRRVNPALWGVLLAAVQCALETIGRDLDRRERDTTEDVNVALIRPGRPDDGRRPPSLRILVTDGESEIATKGPVLGEGWVFLRLGHNISIDRPLAKAPRVRRSTTISSAPATLVS
jgi:hypothetical protein